jgi:hypothetical protein
LIDQFSDQLSCWALGSFLSETAIIVLSESVMITRFWF